MRKLQLSQMAKNAAAFGLVSATTIDAWLLLADNAGVLNVPPNWYLNAPVLVWGVMGLPLSINLAERLISGANGKPGFIQNISPGRIHSITQDGKFRDKWLRRQEPTAGGVDWESDLLIQTQADYQS